MAIFISIRNEATRWVVSATDYDTTRDTAFASREDAIRYAQREYDIEPSSWFEREPGVLAFTVPSGARR